MKLGDKDDKGRIWLDVTALDKRIRAGETWAEVAASLGLQPKALAVWASAARTGRRSKAGLVRPLNPVTAPVKASSNGVHKHGEWHPDGKQVWVDPAAIRAERAKGRTWARIGKAIGVSGGWIWFRQKEPAARWHYCRQHKRSKARGAVGTGPAGDRARTIAIDQVNEAIEKTNGTHVPSFTVTSGDEVARILELAVGAKRVEFHRYIIERS